MSRKVFVLSFLLVSFFLLSSCDYTGFQPNSTTQSAKKSKQPSAPISPVLADGSRTSYADTVDKVAPAVVKVFSEVKAKPVSQQLHFGDDFF